MSNLPTNYVDDVLNADVNTRRKYQMIQNGDGTVSLVDVTDYDTVGSSIGAAQVNAQNIQINQNTDDIDTLNQQLIALERGGAMPNLNYDVPIKTLNGNDSYTATATCYLVGTVISGALGAATVSIDGTQVGFGYLAAANTAGSESQMFLRVETGSIVTTSNCMNNALHILEVL